MSKRLESFEGLRFIMMMLIVISHQSFLGEICPVNSFFPKYYSFAVLGVDYFFVLSGFGMMLSSLRKVQKKDLQLPSFKDCISFGVKRIKKVYPVYIITIVVGLVFDIIVSLINGKAISTIILNDSLKLAFVIPLLQSATGTMAFGHAFNGVGWFLSTLFCIYLVSPLLIYLLRKSSKTVSGTIAFMIVDLVLIVVSAYVFGKVEDYTQRAGMLLPLDQLVYISPYRRVFYVLIGMRLALVYNDSPKKLIEKHATAWEITSLFLAAIWFVFRNNMGEGSIIWGIDTLVCVFIMVVFSQMGGRISAFLSTKTMQRLGQLSMYIFLIHYPIKTIGSYFVEKTIGDWTIYTAIVFIVVEFTATYIISNRIYKRDWRYSMV